MVDSSSLGAMEGEALMSTCTEEVPLLFMRFGGTADGPETVAALALLLPPEAAMIVANLSLSRYHERDVDEGP